VVPQAPWTRRVLLRARGGHGSGRVASAALTSGAPENLRYVSQALLPEAAGAALGVANG